MTIREVDLKRRQFLLKSLYGGISSAFALEYAGGIPLLGNFLSTALMDPLAHSLDAFPLMRDAIAGGSSVLRLHQAMAQSSTNDWSVITIKVVNHVATPLVFALGKINDNGTLDMGTGASTIPSISGQATDYMASAGVLSISDMERYRNLRLNKWFADILHYGTKDGKPATEANILGLPAGAVAPFPTNVAIQAGLHLRQGVAVNHSLKGFKVRTTLPDLAKYVEDLGIINSPLGITCFMMGNEYDKAEGTNAKNIICSDAGEVPAMGSKTVADYVKNISQSLNSGYSDLRSDDSNLAKKFDVLAKGKSGLRKELIDSRAEFIRSIDSLKVAAAIEQAAGQRLDPALANGQSGAASGVGARTEFLGQCHYTAQAIMGLSGTPLRNFSLFLNTNDLDGKTLDTLTTNGDNATSIQALTYIEGMRQLAMGLNILSQPIAKGKKVIIQVIAEGGRKQNMTDSTVSFAFVLGPAGRGMLADNLMANYGAISTPGSDVVVDPGDNVKGSVPWSGSELTEEGGMPSAATAKPTVGDLQMGVVDFLADVTGQRAKLPAGRGRYVKLKREA